MHKLISEHNVFTQLALFPRAKHYDNICGERIYDSRLFRALTEAGSELFFEDRKLYDIAAVAARDKWPSTEQYAGHLQQLIGQILVEGRQAGEFERKTPLDEATLAVYMVMCPFINPVQLQYNLDTAPTAAVLLASLILRRPR